MALKRKAIFENVFIDDVFFMPEAEPAPRVRRPAISTPRIPVPVVSPRPRDTEAIIGPDSLPVRIPPPPPPVPLRVIEMEAFETQLDLTSVDGLLPNPPMGAQSFVHKRIIGAVTGFAKGGFVGAATGFVTSGRGLGSDRGAGLGLPSVRAQSFAATCPPGSRADASGRCATTGFRGAVERTLPFGRTGFQERVASGGLLNMLHGGPEAPSEVGTITRDDGTVGPILRCPPGMVLAIDDQCYAKGLKGLAQFRKWKPGTRPFLTGGDVKVLRRANTLRRSKGTKRLLKELGLG